MTKEVLLLILDYSILHNIPEKEASFKIIGKRQYLTYWKKLYNINVYAQGKNPNSNNRKRLHDLNDMFFNKISALNSYYAGFIAADGNVNKNVLTIGLSIKDEDFLNTFNTNILSTYTLYKNKVRDFECCYLTVSSLLFVNDLKHNFNICERKSLILMPPELDTVYKDCFIIGLIDGDGSIGKQLVNRNNTEPTFYISCVGTKDMMMYIKNRFEEILGKSTSNLFCRDNTKNFYSYRISSLNARTIFIYYYENYILQHNLPVLLRKWSRDHYEYCKLFKKKLHTCRRKGVNVFDLHGNLIKHFDTLKDTELFTGVAFSRISALCKKNSNLFESNGFMFSRNLHMDPYVFNKCINTRYLEKLKELDKGITNIEDEQSLEADSQEEDNQE